MDPIEASRAQACHDSYLQRCIEEGYIPYRSGLLGMAHLIDPASAYGQILARIKDALDPEQVIAPGRYITNKRHQSRFQLKR
jgi:4-cresol dehydrogenase (hydroxylating)